MNTQLFTTKIVTQLAEQPVIRVRIHQDKYIPCTLVRCHFSNDPENVFKQREYIYVQDDEVLLDARPGLANDRDREGNIELRGAGEVHPDDWIALKNHWRAVGQAGSWEALTPQSPPLETVATFAVDLKSEWAIDQVKAIAHRTAAAFGYAPRYGEAAEHFIRYYQPPQSRIVDDEGDDNY